MGYDAFISYAHDADADLAPALSQGLGRLAKPWYRRRALSVFCDTSTLSANPGLWTSIQESMAESAYLVVLTSPDAAASPWVGREIEHWVSTKGAGSILLALTAGELVWDDTTGGFDPARSTALPPALHDAFDEEPLWVDLRFTEGATDTTLRNPAFLDAVALLAAPMHGTSKDELVGEDVRQHRRTLRLAWAAAACVALLAVAAIAGALIARDQADTAKSRAAEALAARGSAAEARKARDEFRSQADSAVKDRDAANAETKTAKNDRSAAQRDAAAARAVAETSAQIADQKASEALAASQEAARQQAIASDAQENATAAVKAKADAEAAALAALDAQAAAENAAAIAARDAANAQVATAAAQKQQAIAEFETAAANAERDLAQQDAADAAASAQATGLAAAALQPEAVSGSVDTALLTALASTMVAPADVAAAALPSPAAPIAASRGALTQLTQYARNGLRNHLQFPNREAPLELRTVAVSPHGGRVAAAETSYDIQTGAQPARLYVWLDGYNPADRAAELSSRLPAGETLGCVRELHWVAGGSKLVTVEDPDGCLNPTPSAIWNTAPFELVDRTVRIWDLATPGAAPVTYTHAVSQTFSSPVVVSSDGSLLAVQLAGGTLAFDYASSSVSSLPTFLTSSAFLGGDSIDDAASYLVGVAPELADPTKFTATIWQRQSDTVVWLPSLVSLFAHLDPTGTVVASPVTVPGLESVVALFDPATGALVDVVEAGGPVCSVALGGDGLLAVSFSPSNACATEAVVSGFDWTTPVDPPAWTSAPVTIDPGQGQTLSSVGTSPQGRWVTVPWSSGPVGVETTVSNTVVLDGASGARAADVRGEVVAFDRPSERYLVVSERGVEGDGFRLRTVAWDLGASPGVPVLTARDSDVVVSRDGRSVAVFPTALPVAPGEAPVAIWPLDPIGLAVGVRELPSPPGRIHSAAFDDDGLLVGVGATFAGIVWDPKQHAHDTIDVLPPGAGPTASPCAADGASARVSATSPWDARARAYTLDGTTLVLRGIDPTHPGAAPVDAPTALPLAPGERIYTLGFARDGRHLLVNLFDPALPDTGANPCKLTRSLVVQIDPSGPVPVAGSATAFPDEVIGTSGDGSRIAFLSLDPTLSPRRSQVIVRDAADLAVTWTVDTGKLGEDDIAVAENLYTLDRTGDRLAGTNGSGDAYVWDRATTTTEPGGGTTPLRVYHASSQPSATVPKFGGAFANDGRVALKWSDDVVYLFDVDRPGVAPITKPMPSDKTALRLRFSDDGEILLVDGIHLLDGRTLARIGPRLHPSGWIAPTDLGSTESFITHDGRYVVRQRTDYSEVVVWPIGLDLMRAEACARAGRNLTDREVAELEITVAGANALCSAYGPGGA